MQNVLGRIKFYNHCEIHCAKIKLMMNFPLIKLNILVKQNCQSQKTSKGVMLYKLRLVNSCVQA